MFATVRPKLNLNFAQTKKLDPRITFERASTATYFDKKGILRLAPADTPRFEHDPITGECLGLLIECTINNNLLYSEDLTDVVWSQNATITANTTVAPDGQTTADTVNFVDSSVLRYVYQTISVSSSKAYTFSYWRKYGTKTANKHAIYDATNAAWIVAATVAPSGKATGNGWERVYVTFTTPATCTSVRCYLDRVDIGDAVGTIYFWGAQLEGSVLPSSYIPTTSAVATRTIDYCGIDGQAFLDFYNQSEGTFLVSFDKGPVVMDGTNPCVFSVRPARNSTDSDVCEVYSKVSPANETAYRYRVGSTAQAFFNVATPDGTRNAIALVYKQDDFAVDASNSDLQKDTSGSLVTMGGINIGHNRVGVSNFALGYPIQRLVYWDERLPDIELKALT